MILQWYSEFDAAQTAWQLIAALLLLLTLLPGLALLLNSDRDSIVLYQGPSAILQGALLLTAGWLLLIFTLTFGPSAGTMPDDTEGETLAPQSMQEMMRAAATNKDQRPWMGRGGLVGNIDFMLMGHFESQGNSEAPLFAARRPWTRIPLSILSIFQLCIFLTAAAATFVAVQTRIPQPITQLLFVFTWGCFVYAPAVHWTWGEGWLGIRNVMDNGGSVLMLICVGTTYGIRLLPAITLDVDGQVVSAPQLRVPRPVAQLLFIVGLLPLASSLGVYSIPVRAITVLNLLAGGSGGLLSLVILRGLAPGRCTSTAIQDGFLWGLLLTLASSSLVSPVTALVCGCSGTVVMIIIAEASLTLCACFKAPLFRLTVCLLIGMLFPGLLGTSATGVQNWDGSLIQSMIHGSSELLLWQCVAAVSVLIWSALVTYALLRLTQIIAKPQDAPERVRVLTEQTTL